MSLDYSESLRRSEAVECAVGRIKEDYEAALSVAAEIEALKARVATYAAKPGTFLPPACKWGEVYDMLSDITGEMNMSEARLTDMAEELMENVK